MQTVSNPNEELIVPKPVTGRGKYVGCPSLRIAPPVPVNCCAWVLKKKRNERTRVKVLCIDNLMLE